MDTARYARCERPGHALTGVRDKTGAEKRAGSGYDFAHAIVDDHSRLAYVELLGDERATTVTAFVTRASPAPSAKTIHHPIGSLTSVAYSAVAVGKHGALTWWRRKHAAAPAFDGAGASVNDATGAIVPVAS